MFQEHLMPLWFLGPSQCIEELWITARTRASFPHVAPPAHGGPRRRRSFAKQRWWTEIQSHNRDNSYWSDKCSGAISLASFPTVLFITVTSLTYSAQLPLPLPPPLPPPLPLPPPSLSAWDRHSGKYILWKRSSGCYSWFHKWWQNGKECDGVNEKRWLFPYDLLSPNFFHR